MSTHLQYAPLIQLNHWTEDISVRFGMTIARIDVTTDGRVTIDTIVPDRDHGHEIYVSHRHSIDPRSPMPVVEQLRDILRRAVMHEIDESLRVNGVLLHDPHS